MSSSSPDAPTGKTLRRVVGERPRRAFTHLVADGGWVIGLAIEDEPGYHKMHYGPFKTEEEARLTSDFMNRRVGIDEEIALRIVLSSIGAQNVAERRTRTS